MTVQRRARADFERRGPSHHSTTKAAFAQATLLVVTAARGLYAELDVEGTRLEREPVGHKRGPAPRARIRTVQRPATRRSMTPEEDEMLRVVLAGNFGALLDEPRPRSA